MARLASARDRVSAQQILLGVSKRDPAGRQQVGVSHGWARSTFGCRGTEMVSQRGAAQAEEALGSGSRSWEELGLEPETETGDSRFALDLRRSEGA